MDVRIFMRLAFACAIATSVLAQTLNPSPREIVKTTRALAPAEIAVVLAAAREAVAGRAFKLSYVPGGMGPEVVIRADGRPRFERAVSGYNVTGGSASSSTTNGTTTTSTTTEQRHVDLTEFTHFTGETARACNGSPLSGELVVAYKNEGKGWTATARLPTAHEFAAPLFDILAGVIPVESGGVKDIGGRAARAFVAPWKPPADVIGSTLPPNTTQALWIDTDSLLPVRWGISIPAMPDRGMPAIPDYGLSFTYDATIVLAPPDEVQPPTCIR